MSHLFIYPLTYIAIHLFIHLPSTHKLIHQSIHPSIFLLICPSTHSLLYLFIYTSAYFLPIHLTHPSHPSVYPSSSTNSSPIHLSIILPSTYGPLTPSEPIYSFIHPPSLVSKLSLQCLLCSRFYDS